MLVMPKFPDMKPGELQNFKSEKEGSVIELSKKDVWQVKETIFTAVFPAGFEPSPFLVAECRRHDPNFLLIWCSKIMITPAGTEEAHDHYVICRHVPSSEIKIDLTKRPIKLGAIPKDFPFKSDSIYEVDSWTVKWPKGSWGAKLGIPDPAKPLDEKIIAYVEKQEWLHRNLRVQDALLSLAQSEEDEENELRKVMEEAEYELKQDWRDMKKCVEEGRLLPNQVWEPKPFVETPKASGEQK